MDMLRFLTQKLRSQSLNEVRPFHTENDSDHDSGTESDTENTDYDQALSEISDDTGNTNRMALKLASDDLHTNHYPPLPHMPTLSNTSPSYSKSGFRSIGQPNRVSDLSGSSDFDIHTPSPSGSSDFDQLSSDDDELNSIMVEQSKRVFHLQDISLIQNINSPNAPEKRKWSQVNKNSGLYSDNSSASSDEEVKELFMPAPVCFSSSPPQGVCKLMSPPPKLFLANVYPSYLHKVKASGVKVTDRSSPRKRHRLTAPSNQSDKTVIQRRPYLDFDKMQQKTLARKYCLHQRGMDRTRLVKIRTVNARSHKMLYPDPEVFAFRSISTAYNPMTPVEAPPMAY